VDIVDNVCKPFQKSVKMYRVLKKYEEINNRKPSVSRELHNNSTFSVDKAVENVDSCSTAAEDAVQKVRPGFLKRIGRRPFGFVFSLCGFC